MGQHEMQELQAHRAEARRAISNALSKLRIANTYERMFFPKSGAEYDLVSRQHLSRSKRLQEVHDELM